MTSLQNDFQESHAIQQETLARRKQQRQRAQAFRQLLDPTNLLPGHKTADLYSLRHLCLQGDGIPDANQGGSSRLGEGALGSAQEGDGWLRAQAWRVLLGYLGPEKAEWDDILAKRRGDYYRFVEDLLPSSSSAQRDNPGDHASQHDDLIGQIYRDLSRSRQSAFAFYRQTVTPSESCPLSTVPEHVQPSTSHAKLAPRIDNRHALLERLIFLNNMGEEDAGQDASLDLLSDCSMSADMESSFSQSISGETPIKNGHNAKEAAIEADASSSNWSFTDVRWHSMLRILYVFALLNPSVGYVQGMNEVLFVLLYVLSTSASPPTNDDASGGTATAQHSQPSGQIRASSLTQSDSVDALYVQTSQQEAQSPLTSSHEASAHAEADAFWCFSALLGEMRELYDFSQVDAHIAGLSATHDRQDVSADMSVEEDAHPRHGIAKALRRYSLRLQWLDDELWRALHLYALDPVLPHYSLRWLTCLLSTELALPSILRIWDVMFAEAPDLKGSDDSSCSPKIEFLIDTCCALLIAVRSPLLATLKDGNLDSSDKFEEAFARAITLLQDLGEVDVASLVESAVTIRQRRLAAPLTGDGPSEEFSTIDLDPQGTVTPSLFSGWSAYKRSRPHVGNLFAPEQSDTTSETDALPTRMQRYADAISTSDAAASFSKARSNWQARALATWEARAAANAKPARDTSERLLINIKDVASQTRNISLSDFGAKWRARGSERSGHGVQSRLEVPGSGTHPSLRWSRTGVPPELPLPDLSNSPREDDSLSPTVCSTPESKNFSATFQSPSMGREGSRSKDATAIFGRFAHLPSLANAQPQQDTHVQTMPKPLLLQRSAGPPRDSPSSDRTRTTQIASRKVSSGPLAATGHSPTIAAHPTRTARKVSNESAVRSNGSVRYNEAPDESLESSSPSAGRKGSRSSQRSSSSKDSEVLDTDNTFSKEDTWPPKASSPNGSKLGKSTTPPPPPVPSKLPSFESIGDELNANLSQIFESYRDHVHDKAEDKDGTMASPLASARSRRPTLGRIALGDGTPTAGPDTSESNNHTSSSSVSSGLAFGGVTSSSDVPLATHKTSLQRHFRRKPSEGASVGSITSADVSITASSNPQRMTSRRTQSGSIGAASYGSRVSGRRRSSAQKDATAPDSGGDSEASKPLPRPARGTISSGNYI